jgi:hypothetical protein
VIIVGAGVTLSATADASGTPLSRITWTGLIRNGLDYLVNNGHVDASNRRTKRAYEALEDPDIDSLLDAANTLSSQLTQEGQFPSWLETVFGNLDKDIRHPAILKVLKALHEKGATLLTTNYDGLLEKYCNLHRIGRSNRDEILKFKRGELDGVFHVHGSYHDPQEVVLNTTDYYKITHSDEVQNILKTFLEYKTMLFVGCGSGLEDPNFDALLKWASERQKNVPNRHCLLIRNGDTLDYKPLVRLKYGDSYQDLVPYLHKILNHPLQSAYISGYASTEESCELFKYFTPAGMYLKFIVNTSRRYDPDGDEYYLSKLPYATDAAFNSRSREHEPQCLAHTRVDLLRQLMAWSNNPRDKCIFWLNGMAGTGKSTIARTVARTFYDQDRLGGSFFFSRGGGDLAKADKFFTTLSVQLAKMSPDLKRYICDAIARHGNIDQQSLHDQWKQLIFRPISMLKHGQLRSTSLIFVIDALDECEHRDDIKVILRLFAEANDLKRMQLRVLVTSRPETPVRLGFGDISVTVHEDFVLHNIDQSIIEHDISIFLKHELKSIKEKRGLFVEWPNKQIVDLLAQRTGSLFIYAATVCRFIGDSKFPNNRLKLITQGTTAHHPYKPSKPSTRILDEMYTNILVSSVEDCDEEDKPEASELFRQIIGCIVILFDALSVAALSELLSVESEMIGLILNSLHSVLDVPECQDSPIRLFHPSFRDFLLDEQRCLDDQFIVNEKRAHSALVESCLKVMSNALKRDICGLQMPGALTTEVESNIVSRYLPVHVQYACRYWIDHLQRGEIGLCDDNGQIHKFLQQHFLHWLEALSLMGKMSEGVLMITVLQSMLTVSDFVLPRYDLRRRPD